ncbi:Bifunctional inhibitor/lipid-transfer protein/seed storage 2S albumin superfamily protein isoform 1 [Hibiscus syriacus]|uniref:Bifunctional inhibitor/lipid-transfer protein/seed storage 2S albumin superfamily protein isoform 1 n=1 Tax=Hibiscus syriacus TaxID=106335 RepID=A0A6A2ZZA9_HIBSY|nr:glutathione S-transferase U8-like [Hibiscus syriacus]KAE8696549.1 Bifunctional inhibitor/lipid-transfer protein/seed storage 2S albumin superfamily protein isoform 1 [Hibiscus syriacus]
MESASNKLQGPKEEFCIFKCFTMGEEELKVFGAWGSPFSRRVEIALELKGVPSSTWKRMSCVRVWKALPGSGEEREKAMEEVRECLKELESVLDGKRFIVGETIGLVDISTNFIAFWLRCIQEVSGLDFMNAEQFPLLIKWCEEFVSCNVVKEHMPPRDKLITFMKN